MTKTENLIAKLLTAAQNGDAAAQYELATRYREGHGVPENLSDSLKWYRKAAEARHPNAMNDLGSMLLDGHGCKADPAEAFKWYELAAKAGHPVACYNLAKRYLHDEIDLPQAFHWFSEAARQDYVEAICELGTMYRFGQGTGQNLIAAADFHLIAAKKGDVVAMGNLSDYLDELQTIALAGNPTASRCLSEVYNLGLGAERSMPLTWTWIKWAKEGCTLSDDAYEAGGIEGAYDFYKSILSTGDRKEGERVLKNLIVTAGKSAAPKEPLVKRKRGNK